MFDICVLFNLRVDFIFGTQIWGLISLQILKVQSLRPFLTCIFGPLKWRIVWFLVLIYSFDFKPLKIGQFDIGPLIWDVSTFSCRVKTKQKILREQIVTLKKIKWQNSTFKMMGPNSNKGSYLMEKKKCNLP